MEAEPLPARGEAGTRTLSRSARFLGFTQAATRINPAAPCPRGMHAPPSSTPAAGRKKPKIPAELQAYWDRRLFERREKDLN
ncbi:MAG: hypothetical protein LC624_00505 [Halobacteriales archaeon]|nr:hypothetical protein [Halobacteriales archaeon]